MDEQEREIMAINVDMSCDKECEDCEKFFECENQEKYKIYDRRRMARTKQKMADISYKIAIVGGKGGVGKSITTANIAMALAMKGRSISILDQDFDGPCIPKMLGVTGKRLIMDDTGIVPITGHLGIQIISMGLILKDDDVLTWFHDMRRNATEEFLTHVNYGKRDYLFIDLPPGTSSDSVNLMQYIPDLSGAIIVTIPSEVSQGVAKKATILCKKARVKIFGIIENMSGYVCPTCNTKVNILQYGGGEKLAQEMEVPFLGRIPLDPRLSRCSDEGEPFVYKYPDSEASRAVMKVAEEIEKVLNFGG